MHLGKWRPAVRFPPPRECPDRVHHTNLEHLCFGCLAFDLQVFIRTVEAPCLKTLSRDSYDCPAVFHSEHLASLKRLRSFLSLEEIELTSWMMTDGRVDTAAVNGFHNLLRDLRKLKRASFYGFETLDVYSSLKNFVPSFRPSHLICSVL